MQTKPRFARRFSAGLQRPHALETARPMTPMRQRRLAPRAARTGMAPSGGVGWAGAARQRRRDEGAARGCVASHNAILPRATSLTIRPPACRPRPPPLGGLSLSNRPSPPTRQTTAREGNTTARAQREEASTSFARRRARARARLGDGDGRELLGDGRVDADDLDHLGVREALLERDREPLRDLARVRPEVMQAEHGLARRVLVDDDLRERGARRTRAWARGGGGGARAARGSPNPRSREGEREATSRVAPSRSTW